MSYTPTVEDVVEAFKQRGFVFVGTTSDGWFRLNGPLRPPGSAIDWPCEVQLDRSFIELPRIRLFTIPPGLSGAVPHLAADGGLCYLAKGAVTLDIYDPIGQSLACAERAAWVLGRILKGEMIEDLQEEFFAYWQGLYCLADIEGDGLGEQSCLVGAVGESMMWFITDNVDRTNRKLSALGYKSTDETILTYRIKTSAQPRPLQGHWPPETVADVLAWQSVLDPRCRRKIHERVTEGDRSNARGVLIVIESPVLTYGFGVLYDRENRKPTTKFSVGAYPTFGLKIIPLSVVRIDDGYLAQRNMPKAATLGGKHLTLVGCGTIGGYLAEMLVKAGAGTCGGQLTLVDFDSLLPQNIGRHRLGFADLLSNKAEAMARELRRVAPSADIRALPVDVRRANLGKLDLLIDATGEQALGHWLAGRYPRPTSMMSVWIEGPGTAVRALLRLDSPRACYRCLWHSAKRQELRSIVEPLPHVLAGQGCEGLYVPFPASVSVHTAALGAEMALDWANGVTTPALRTRLLDHTKTLATADCDPPHDSECPLCGS